MNNLPLSRPKLHVAVPANRACVAGPALPQRSELRPGRSRQGKSPRVGSRRPIWRLRRWSGVAA